MKKILIFTICSVLFFVSCASNKKDMFDDYNLSDKEWLLKIINSIQKADLEKADSDYISLYSEHINSPLLASAMLILSQAHAKEHEYLLANYYIDEYIKLYGSSNNYEWLNYMKLKNNFNAFSQANRNQALLEETLNDVGNYTKTTSDEVLKYLASTMQTKLELAKIVLYKDIKDLYHRMGHQTSEKVYDEIIKNEKLNTIDYIKPKKPWYRELFEGSYSL